MNEFQTFLYLIGLVGISFGLAYGTILDELKTYCYVWGLAYFPSGEKPIRSLIVKKTFDFVNCPMCMGLWIGLVASLAYKPFIHWLLDGFIVSGLCYILDRGEDSSK